MSKFLPNQVYPIVPQDFVSAKFSVRLKELRIEKNLTQEKIAEILNVTVKTYRSWEKGNLPKVIDLFNLANIFDCSVDYLLGRISDKNRIDAYIRDNLPLSGKAVDKLFFLGCLSHKSRSLKKRLNAFYISQILEYLINTEEGGFFLDQIRKYLQSSGKRQKKEYVSLLHGKTRYEEGVSTNEYLEDIADSLSIMKSYFAKFPDLIFVNPNADGSFYFPPYDKQ